MSVVDFLGRLFGCGARVVSCVPGFGASEVFSRWGEVRGEPWAWSLHEEVAWGRAQGCAVFGQPAVCLLKVHGLAKAANAVVCSLSMGVRAPFLALVFEDRSGRHSDNVLRAAPLLRGLELPFVAPSCPSELTAAWSQAWEGSLRSGLPWALVLDSEWFGDLGEPVILERQVFSAMRFVPRPVEELVCPVFGEFQRARLEARLEGSGVPKSPALPRLENLPSRWVGEFKAFEPWMSWLQSQGRAEFVAGDTGLSSLYGMAPHQLVDCVGWMGGSIPLAMGALEGGAASAWAFCGDFAFASAGIVGWLEAIRLDSAVQVFIFDNGRAAATGGQDLGSLVPQLISLGPCKTWQVPGQPIKLNGQGMLHWLQMTHTFCGQSSSGQDAAFNSVGAVD